MRKTTVPNNKFNNKISVEIFSRGSCKGHLLVASRYENSRSISLSTVVILHIIGTDVRLKFGRM